MPTQLVINPKQNRFIIFGFVCFEEKDAMSMRNTSCLKNLKMTLLTHIFIPRRINRIKVSIGRGWKHGNGFTAITSPKDKVIKPVEST
jgi:hypothetical protein